MGIVKRARADPTHDDGEGDVDAYEVDVSTDSSGAGNSTQSWAEDFDTSTPTVVASVLDAQGEAYVSARGSSQATVEVVNGPASTTVTVAVIAVGERD